MKDKTQVKKRKLVKDERHVKKKQQSSKGEEKQAGKVRKVKSAKRREGHTRRMAFYRTGALREKDPQRYSAVIACHKYRNQPIHAQPIPKVQKRDANGVVRFASDCSGLGTDAISTKQACHKGGQKIEIEFMTEKVKRTRMMHATLNKFHALKPKKKFSDIARRPGCKDIDLYVAGPPCQPWSLQTQGKGAEDEKGRGSVIYLVCDFVRSSKPKSFIIENVPGLLKRHPVDFAAILHSFVEADYKISWSIQDASTSGCPQSRPRIYIIGLRSDCCYKQFTWPQNLRIVPPLSMFLDSDPQAAVQRSFNDTETRNYNMWETKMKKAGISLGSETFMMDLQAGKGFGCCVRGKSPCLTYARGKTGGYYISTQNRYTNINEMGRLQGFTTEEVGAIVKSGATKSQIGAAFGNAMHKMVLDRIVPKVLYAAGLCDEKIEDPWKKFDWKKFDGKGKIPDVNAEHTKF